MDLLLDSHVFLWWDEGNSRLSETVLRAIADPENHVVVSAASVWEIAVKRALGKLDFPGVLVEAIVANGFETLSIAVAHAERAAALPGHHKDPFDRMIVAQGLCEGLVIVTHDQAFALYGVPCLWT